jgi:glycosyltransferase involved in cell wall biosynthesis
MRRHADDVAWVQSTWERLLHRACPHVGAGLSMFLRRNQYDVVVTEHYRTALVFGLLCNLFGRRSRHVVKELYLDDQVLQRPVVRSIFRIGLSRCDCIVSNCSAEIGPYSRFLNLPAERFRFVPWPSNLSPERADSDDGTIFAAGRAFRDWPVLFAAARRIAARFVVVAEASAVAGLEKPENVELHCNVPRRRYLDLLRRAQIVLVPLVPTVRSIGQAVILEGMALGKAVLTARVPAVLDYVDHGSNGWLYEAEDGDSLVRQLNRLLAYGELRRRLGEGALESVRNTFNKVHYADRLLALYRELVGGDSPENTTGRLSGGTTRTRRTPEPAELHDAESVARASG